MDEIEIAKNLKNLRVLIDHTTEPDNVYAHVNIKNALLVVAAVLEAHREQITELQFSQEDC